MTLIFAIDTIPFATRHYAEATDAFAAAALHATLLPTPADYFARFDFDAVITPLRLIFSDLRLLYRIGLPLLTLLPYASR